MRTKQPNDVQVLVLKKLDQALEIKIGLSKDDQDYNYHYLKQKLALCSEGMERLRRS